MKGYVTNTSPPPFGMGKRQVLIFAATQVSTEWSCSVIYCVWASVTAPDGSMVHADTSFPARLGLLVSCCS